MHDQQKETREDLLKKTDEELRTLMMQSLVSEEIDMEYINCITDILAMRHPEEYVFQEEGIWEAALQASASEHEQNASKSFRAKRRKGTRTLRKMLATAAMIAILITTLFAIPVQGENLFSRIAHWTSELFSLGSSETDKVQEEGLFMDGPANSTELRNFLIKNGITAQIVPTYIPEEFELQEISVESEDPTHQKIYAEFLNGTGETITISIRNYESLDPVVEKDDGSVSTYLCNGISHYIFSNLGAMVVSWSNGGFYCTLVLSSNAFSEQTLHQMIDSIYIS